ncbi:hypothetical protein [Nocardia seriolae]|uniref:hypothetical protein n=1 Tax=Nocardia seriolae TaxID=37332 RepID=UPI00051A4572|nr:hypothetical protein [Nocardia seriolae]MTJ60524.1 hypothetical protein [Nocardia seriolae]MTJ72245.1 hypothetical protein [Nocardia seriolae]MTJ84592.1 hypothetical protein [Nocardia seriolae]MTK28580.1 hypothetical protein [Nocardia seriolae]MTK38507.1 hypothetical protein [Nocardia seriolae]
MGIVISSVATEIGGDSIEQAAAAARRVMADAGITPDRIDALINTGGYRDSNMAEPAMSALIQQRAGIGLEYHSGDVPCLSFDLMNGACGILNAIQVSQALLEAPTVHRVLLVAGDARPSKSAGPQPGFPIEPVGAAMLLEKTPGTAGFGALHISATDGRPAEGYPRPSEMGTTGRSSMLVNRSSSVEELLHHAISAAGEALEVADADLDRTVLICGRPTADFPDLLARRLGITTVAADDTESHAQTSALPVAYLAARDSGKLARADVALCVAAGAGPSAAAIAYRLPKP